MTGMSRWSNTLPRTRVLFQLLECNAGWPHSKGRLHGVAVAKAHRWAGEHSSSSRFAAARRGIRIVKPSPGSGGVSCCAQRTPGPTRPMTNQTKTTHKVAGRLHEGTRQEPHTSNLPAVRLHYPERARFHPQANRPAGPRGAAACSTHWRSSPWSRGVMSSL